MSQRNSPQKRSHRVSPRVVTGVVLAGLAVVFVLENRQVVDIRVLLPVVTAPLWAALLAVLVIGVIVGFLLNRPHR
ncbi:LapA family protein [Saccharopolyspora taberi]|uniref:Lipopolysaccharide assembly protein A domain-containing protein n=1 Tax=Saccharopolyspora taberi TaxID=60895 RepID=A0ABN3VMT6_9PSEU